MQKINSVKHLTIAVITSLTIGISPTFASMDVSNMPAKFLFGGFKKVGDFFGVRNMSIPNDWTTLNVDGVKFGVSPTGIIMFRSNTSFLYNSKDGGALTEDGLWAATGETKEKLASFAKHPGEWAKYLDKQSCDNLSAIEGSVEKSMLPASMQTGNTDAKCDNLYLGTIKWANKVNNSLKGSIFGSRAAYQIKDNYGYPYSMVGNHQ